eukprot:UN31494
MGKQTVMNLYGSPRFGSPSFGSPLLDHRHRLLSGPSDTAPSQYDTNFSILEAQMTFRTETEIDFDGDETEIESSKSRQTMNIFTALYESHRSEITSVLKDCIKTYPGCTHNSHKKKKITKN